MAAEKDDFAEFFEPEDKKPDALPGGDTPTGTEETPPTVEETAPEPEPATPAPEVPEEEAAPASPEAPAEGAKETPAADKTDPVESLRAELRTQTGRLLASEDEKNRLAERLSRLETKLAAPATPEPPAPKTVAIPDELSPDAEAFAKAYPKLAPMLTLAGPDGDAIRATLKDYGPAVAAMAARTVQLETELHDNVKRLETERVATSQQEHAQRIVARHPEFAGLFGGDATAQTTAKAARDAVVTWIETMPFKDGAARMQVLQQGTADQVNALLDEYQNQQTAKPKAKPLSEDAQRRADAAIGVEHSRVSRPPRGKPDENDVDAAFSEAFEADK